MGYRLKTERSLHCSFALGAALCLTASPGAWGHEASAQVKPVRKLDLYSGHAQDLLPSTQWQTLLASQPTETQPPLSDSRDWSDGGNPVVEVKGQKTVPNVPGGLGALFWALRHPSQAWRILAPAQ